MNSRVTQLLREAADWRMIGLLFECPSADWRGRLDSMAGEIRDEALRAAGQAALAEGAEGVYHSILGPGGPAPAREVSYHDSVELGYLVSELTYYYSAFAYQPETCEALDHISVEAGFVGYLRLKEAFALANGEEEKAAVAADGAAQFLKDHLSYVAQPLCESLSQSGVGYLAAAGKSLLARVGPQRTLPVIDSLTGKAFCSEANFDCGASPT